MSKIITKKELNLVIENTLKEAGLKMEVEMCEECGSGTMVEGVCNECGTSYMEESENVKPDFLDLDGDGDTEEPMKKAAKEKDEVEESVEELTESLFNTTNNKLLKEEMNNFNKLINYKF
jgi:hypothetical protein